MRTSEERIAALHRRAGEIKREDRGRRVRLAQIAGTAACFVFVAAMAIVMPQVVPGPMGQTRSADGSGGGLYGSILTDSAYLGYIVIGIVAFLLGVALTLFLFRLKKWQEDRDREDEIK